MGRVRTKTVKRASKSLIEKYYPRLTTDFETNKRLIDSVAYVPSKRLRNKVAGYTSHLMRRIAKGPVNGVSFALQEEERERRDQYVPDRSALDVIIDRGLAIDRETADLLKNLVLNVEADIKTPTTGFPDRRFRKRY